MKFSHVLFLLIACFASVMVISCEKNSTLTISQFSPDEEFFFSDLVYIVKDSMNTQIVLDSKAPWAISETGEHYLREATASEMDQLARIGIGPKMDRTVSCSWDDGNFGSMDCDGGRCKVVWQTGRNTGDGGSTPEEVLSCLSCSEGSVCCCGP